MKIYTHMVVEKITGLVLSCHTSLKLAEASWRKGTTDKKPLEIRDYSTNYVKTMGRV